LTDGNQNFEVVFANTVTVNSSLLLNGINVLSHLSGAYAKANTSLSNVRFSATDNGYSWNVVSNGTSLVSNATSNVIRFITGTGMTAEIDVSNNAVKIGTLAYGVANAAFAAANSSTGGVAYLQANSARDQANAAFVRANVGTSSAQSAFDQANTANTRAFNTVLKAGDTMTGNLVMSANIAFANGKGLYFTGTTLIKSDANNTMTLVANTTVTDNVVAPFFLGDLSKMIGTISGGTY